MSQVNLLPPELRARQKTKQLTTLIIGAGAARDRAAHRASGSCRARSWRASTTTSRRRTPRTPQLQAQIDQLQEFQQLQEQAAAQEALLAKAWVGEVSFSEMLMDLSRTIPSDAYLDSFNATLAVPVTAGAVAPTTTTFVGAFTAGGAADGFESLASWITRLESVKGWVNPWVSSATETGAEHRAVHVHQRGRPFGGRAHASRPRGRAGWGVSARRSSPASASPSSCVLVAFFLVLPKMGQVKDANAALADAQSQQATLGAQLAALQAAQTEAPANRETIRKVQQAIPPTVDQQGFMLLMQNAAVESAVDVVTISPGNPVFDPATGLSTVTNSISATGTYFALTEFLFKIETLPRAAKATSVAISPSPSDTNASLLTLTASVDIYTSDQSAGPGSTPGPTPAAGSTTPTTPTGATGASPAAETKPGA